ncbi:primase-helicase family protein [Mesorhizobium sp. M0036]|uniref:primase-helicase family protein n=1 Tax=Mesorhizobium sp. M0036 TaxID=2956853 RepID=UPI00333E0129
MSSVAPDTAVAIAFLLKYAPEGHWHLTAISPDRKSIRSATFSAAEAEQCRTWIDGRNGRENIYFSLNQIKRPLNKKAAKDDIAVASCLHVDLDPRSGENLTDERKRILELLTTGRPPFVPEPSVVLDSGGGYWAIWKLEPPQAITGADEIDLLERYNLGLATVLGGDACHNIDRIARLPGTVNVPDENKLRKGRLPALATVWSFDEGLRYTLDSFEPAPAVQADVVNAPAGQVFVPGAPKFLVSINELDRWNVDERLKIVCVQGRDPATAKTKADDSRSAWLFDAVCGLVRAQVPDEIIHSIILDPSFAISESVLDKGRNSSRYAIRQIERAKEFIIHPYLRDLNERHAVIMDWGGKCRIATFGKEAHSNRTTISMQTFQDIRDGYLNKRVPVGTTGAMSKEVPLGKWWLEHPMRRQYREIVFDPLDKAASDQLNLWTGFAVEPLPGDWSLMRQHILEVLAKGNEAWSNYIIRWTAWAIQNPDRAAEVALVFIGGKGTGKGTFGNALCTIFGQHALHVFSAESLVGRFNAHLRDVCLLFADEAYWPGDKSAEGALKGLITEPEIAIEAKGVDMVKSTNRLHVLMASNENWVVPASMDERRFAIFDLASHRAGDDAYFHALHYQLYNEGGLAAMLIDLQQMDLAGWHPRQGIPKTDALAQQQAESLSPIDQFWFDCLVSGELPPFAQLDIGDEAFMPTSRLAEHLSKTNRWGVTSVKVAAFLGAGRNSAPGMGFVKDDSRRPRGFRIPRLEKAREIWDKARFRHVWPATGEWERLHDSVDWNGSPPF